MSFRVRIESFEGPFDLLLRLVNQQKVDIGSVSITRIVDQYLEEMNRMEELDLDIASDFLLVAATLLKIKAESLLPTGEEDFEEEIADLEPGEARDLLISKLVRYKKYKNAAASLEQRLEWEGRCFTRPFGPDPRLFEAMPDFLSSVSLDDLGDLASAAFARREVVLLEAEHIAAKPIPVERIVRSVHGRLKSERRLRFSDLVSSQTSTPQVVATFLALLELYKRSMVTVVQSEPFGDIDIEYIEGSGDLSFEGENALTSVEGE